MNNISRFIVEYSNDDDTRLKEYPLKSFVLADFQDEFGIVHSTNEMLDKYPVFECSVLLLEQHLKTKIRWDFLNKSYYLESKTTS